MQPQFSKGDTVRLWGSRRGTVIQISDITPYRYRIRWEHASEPGCPQRIWVDASALEPWRNK